MILFDATARRQPTTRRFGAGLLTYVPQSRAVSHTASDEAAYAEMLADEATARRQAVADFNDHLEERYLRSAQIDRVSRGPIF